MVDFAALKANRKSSFDKLANELVKLTKPEGSGNSQSDDRFWKPTVDKAGNGFAVLRFLPAPYGEDIPYVRIFDHGFQGPGGWYIETSLTTIGQKDPVSELNSKLWNSGIDANKALVRKQKRRLSFISNVLVVKDPSHPENEGKVFLFKYGKKIFDKLNEAMQPPFDEMGRTPEQPGYNPTNAFNPFDLWDGANFNLKIRQVEGYRNYDMSNFGNPGPIASDEEMEKTWKLTNSLQEFLDPKNFKSYDELNARLQKALGHTEAARQENDEALQYAEEFTAPQPKTAPAKAAPTQSSPWDGDEEDDELSFFKKLAKD